MLNWRLRAALLLLPSLLLLLWLWRSSQPQQAVLLLPAWQVLSSTARGQFVVQVVFASACAVAMVVRAVPRRAAMVHLWGLCVGGVVVGMYAAAAWFSLLMLLLAATAWRLQRKLAHTDSWPGDEALMPPHHWYDTPLNFLMAGVFALAVVWLHYHAGPLPYFAGLNYLAKASPSEIVLQALLLLGSAVCLSVSQRRVKRWSLLAFVGAMRSIAAWVFIFASPALGLVLMMQAAVARSLLRQEQQ